jgi:hypothetical protein
MFNTQPLTSGDFCANQENNKIPDPFKKDVAPIDRTESPVDGSIVQEFCSLSCSLIQYKAACHVYTLLVAQLVFVLLT